MLLFSDINIHIAAGWTDLAFWALVLVLVLILVMALALAKPKRSDDGDRGDGGDFKWR